MQIQIILLLVAVVANLILGSIVLSRSPDKPYARYFAFTVFGVAVWGIGDAVLLTARSQELARIGAQLFYGGPLIIPIAIVLFTLTFPDNKKPHRWLWYAASIEVAAWLMLLLLNIDFLVKDILITDTLNIATPRTPQYLIYMAHFSLFFMSAYLVLFLKMRRLRGLARIQASYTMIAVILGSIPALITNLSLPVMGTRDLVWLGPIFTLMFDIVVTMAIIKHRLFDIRLLIARSLGYFFSLSFLLAVYVLGISLFLNILIGDDRNTLVGALINGTLVMVTVLLFNPIKRFFDRLSNRFFFRDSYDIQTYLDKLNAILVSTIDLSDLLDKSVELIMQTLRPTFVRFILVDDDSGEIRVMGKGVGSMSTQAAQSLLEVFDQSGVKVISRDEVSAHGQNLYKEMTRSDVLLAVSISTHQQGIGYIVVGIKQSGNGYTQEDLRVMEITADEFSLAIQNALRFEEIQQFSQKLQTEVKDATKQLRHTNEKLKALDETKDEFISMASHQLRTPLTSVKGYVSMVLDGDAGPINDQQKKLLEQSFISSQRMVYLIADLLNVSRLRTGKFVIEAKPTSLPDVVEGEISQLRDTAKARGLELSYDKPAAFPLLSLDETKIRQVIMNFIDNAIYYTPEGGHIRVELEATDHSVEYRVVDNGLGVPKSEQHHLFTKFYRAGNARKARPDGTGLGLFMAKKVVIAQGGAVIFKSQEGKGSTFGFSFPRKGIEVTTDPPEKL